jgi:hypothetical protein
MSPSPRNPSFAIDKGLYRVPGGLPGARDEPGSGAGADSYTANPTAHSASRGREGVRGRATPRSRGWRSGVLRRAGGKPSELYFPGREPRGFGETLTAAGREPLVEAGQLKREVEQREADWASSKNPTSRAVETNQSFP